MKWLKEYDDWQMYREGGYVKKIFLFLAFFLVGCICLFTCM